jgi:hypothetical protein
MGLGVGLTTLPCKKRKLLRSLQEFQPDFVEEAKVLSWAVEPRKEEEEEEEYNRETVDGFDDDDDDDDNNNNNTLLLPIQEVPSSNPSPETSDCDSFHTFPKTLQ